MAARKTKAPKRAKALGKTNGASVVSDVLTLDEVARWLRLPEDEVARFAARGDLPGRCVGDQWRFLKSALEQWLSTPDMGQAFLSRLGEGKDDPDLEEMLDEIYKRRGRPQTEEE